ncbi:hypothetical protein DL93DRAFT_2223201 [Clavulina sp. PMI_390]|nr:hypothetical protein DL93DRAFT_2223201 [Clavulina sp. PMI_390]
MSTMQSELPRFIDIGVNFTDPIFRGKYRGHQKHADDFNDVVKRSLAAGVQSIIITGGSLHESREALDIAKTLGVFATAGCHPTRSAEFDKYRGGPDAYLAGLDKLIASRLKGSGRVVAVGECGLDYDRLHFANEDTQRKHFRAQLSLAKKYSLPLFLHSRAAHRDFVQILTEEGFAENGGKDVGGKGGVVHSFTGTVDEARELMDMGFHISINGCGLKTAENLATAASIPLDRLMLETDAPWCSMTTAHASHAYLVSSFPSSQPPRKGAGKGKGNPNNAPAASPSASSSTPTIPAPSGSLPSDLAALYNPQPRCPPERFVAGQVVKGRNEPCATGLVAHVMAQLLGVSLEEVSEAAWRNTVEVFGLGGENLHESFGIESKMVVPQDKSSAVEQVTAKVAEFDIKNEEWPSL